MEVAIGGEHTMQVTIEPLAMSDAINMLAGGAPSHAATGAG